MPTKARGRPLRLGEHLDNSVKSFIRKLRQAGGVVNTTIVTAAARGIVEAHNRASLPENGGSLDITNGEKDKPHPLQLADIIDARPYASMPETSVIGDCPSAAKSNAFSH
ncbi:hypothetical protein KP79_PYT26149 [Mizuhopecten yessoensis]|uniref:Uncharacterized protein n=1 Tax=Mizuhopecten yessoensis TaxID=6573 RepID=A0A210QGK9_MIZYE|nr:hypothetical protein KP79_PYT26149 [Mizuhopecten yessoensis]